MGSGIPDYPPVGGCNPVVLQTGVHNAVERSNLLLRLLADTAAHLLAARDGDAIVRAIFDRIAPALDLHAYFNFMVNEAGDGMSMASCAGISDEEARAIQHLDFGQAVCGLVAVIRRPVVATGIQESDDPRVQLVRGYGIRAYACNPLMAGDRLLGTLSFATRSRDSFADDELEFFRTIAHYVAITEERLRLTAALRQQATLLDMAQDAVIFTKLDGTIQYWNGGAGELYGWTSADARGRAYCELLGTSLPCGLEEIRKALDVKPVWQAELQQTRRDGEAVAVWSRWAARCDAEGRQTGFLILEHDVGERARMEERLRQTQRLESLGLLAGGIAHDFNNLLTGILGNASLIEGEVPASAAPHLRQVINGAEQAAHLTRQLLAYSGKGRFLMADINVSDLVRDTAALLRVSVPKTIDIRLDLPPELPAVHADAGQIQQVLMNLVINASDAIGNETGGAIRMRTGTERVRDGNGPLAPGKYVIVTVSDNGCGMDDRTIAKIFDPFFTTKVTGRGLGLSAVLGIMRSCHGHIDVDSGPGRGTTFRLLFPAVHRVQAAPAVSAPMQTAGAGTVLLVDDESSVRGVAKAVLERAGFKVLTAQNGAEAVRLMETAAKIDLVLLDVVMPVMGGVEALCRIRSLRPEAKVVILSGYGVDEVERLCSGETGYAFLQKPFRPDQLVAAVSAALAAGSRHTVRSGAA